MRITVKVKPPNFPVFLFFSCLNKGKDKLKGKLAAYFREMSAKYFSILVVFSTRTLKCIINNRG